MLEISRSLRIPDEELQWTAVRSRGAGGQNVNKVATAVQLRFDVAASESLPDDLKARLLDSGDRRLSANGVLIIKAQRFRSQRKNHDDALQRLRALLRRHLYAPPPRVPTRPPKAADRRRLEDKAHRARLKARRRRPPE